MWCLADFGISRYAEATTSPDTQKFAMSVPYAAPERWRAERATGATDVYALDIMGFELLTGAWPFTGPELFDFRDQHLHADPPPMTNVPMALTSLIAECLYKSPGARPSPQNILTRLQSAGQAPVSPGRARLQQANLQEVARQGESVRCESAHRSEAQRRQDLFRDVTASFKQIGDRLKSAIAEDAPSAAVQSDRRGGCPPLGNIFALSHPDKSDLKQIWPLTGGTHLKVPARASHPARSMVCLASLSARK
ncbi:MAG: protein kinase domain-containing protein [Rhodopila sp.]